MDAAENGWNGFGEWYRVLHPRLSTAMIAIAGDVGLAQEVTDEAFARAWERWNRVASMSSPSGWTYAVALNLLRRRRRRAALEERLLRRSPGAESVPEPASELWSVVAGLPLRQRTALVLRYVADLDENEIGEAMGVSRSTVSTTLTAARRGLAGMIGEESDGTRRAPHG